MSMNFTKLDDLTRSLMLQEVKGDVEANRLYRSPILNEAGRAAWQGFLENAVQTGNEESLARAVIPFLNPTHPRKNPKTGEISMVKMPLNAHERLAHGEFNRFYIRSICCQAIDGGQADVQIYRARHSENPRPESEARVGALCNAQALLDDLRIHPGSETVLRVPGGPNSGISVKLIN